MTGQSGSLRPAASGGALHGTIVIVMRLFASSRGSAEQRAQRLMIGVQRKGVRLDKGLIAHKVGEVEGGGVERGGLRPKRTGAGRGGSQPPPWRW